MGVALDAGLDIGALTGLYVAIGILTITVTLLSGLAGVLNISVLGVRPFGFVAAGIQNTVIAGGNAAINDLQKAAADFESGLLDSLTLLIGIPLLAVVGVRDALAYFWTSALKPTIHSITDPIAHDASQALTKVESLADSIPDVVAAVESYVDAKVAAGVHDAEVYTATNVLAGIQTAESYADQAVSKLRAAEDTAIANAVELANDAKTAGVNAAAAALASAQSAIEQLRAWAAAGITSAEDAVRAGVTTAEHYADVAATAAKGEAEAAASSALAASEATAAAALDQVKAIAIGVEGGLTDLENYVGSLNLPNQLAILGSLAALVAIVLSDTGLENQACRSKVKQICGTDPAVWTALLAGAGIFAGVLDFRQIVEASVQLVRLSADAIGELDQLPADLIDETASVIADAVHAIAA